MSVQLAVIPDAWTGLPPFTPGDRPREQRAAAIMHARMSQMAVTAQAVQELNEHLKRLMWLGLIDADGNPVSAVPANTDLYGNTYRFATGGLVVQ